MGQSQWRFRAALLGLVFCSGILHFWGLNRFNTLVFDEVYFVRFAHNYLAGVPFFDAHPPLGKYLIALGIRLSELLPDLLLPDLQPWLGDGLPTPVDGILLTPSQFRWMNALLGTALPLLLASLAYALADGQTHRRQGFALLAGWFGLLDGLFLVESRYGLINLYLVFFGLGGQLAWVRWSRDYARASSWSFSRFLRPQLWLAGLSLGGSTAVKWNGLGYLLGLWILWGLAHWRPIPGVLWWQGWGRLRAWQAILPLVILPGLAYSLSWWPHLRLTGDSFSHVHQQILSFHAQMGNAVHPYCSPWYSWPLMIRPVAYWYQVALDFQGNPDLAGPSWPYFPIRFAVYGMGNPILWWLATAAVIALGGSLVSHWRQAKQTQADTQRFLLPPEEAISLYLLVNYLANWLPWALISRCTFLYHYMAAHGFALLALAWLVSGWFSRATPRHYWAGGLLIALVGIAFIFWLPLFWGLPLSQQSLNLRWWLPSWP